LLPDAPAQPGPLAVVVDEEVVEVVCELVVVCVDVLEVVVDDEDEEDEDVVPVVPPRYTLAGLLRH
jgi:hypothetical protein